MSALVKLYWDFRGPASAGTAEHFHLHLNEFFLSCTAQAIDSGWESSGEQHHVVFLLIRQEDLPLIKERLRPHRGIYV